MDKEAGVEKQEDGSGLMDAVVKDQDDISGSQEDGQGGQDPRERMPTPMR